MKTNILLTMVLMAGMMLAGCAKEESSEEPRKGNNMEQTLTKEQIVGVWRSGDYWVSFSEDGFMCGYLSDKCIVEGGYEVFQDQIIVVSNFFEHNITMFKITDITEDVLKCDVKYSEIEVSTNYDNNNYNQTVTLNEAEATMGFTKSQEKPTSRESELIGKGFKFNSNYVFNMKFSNYEDWYEQEVECQSDGGFYDGWTIVRQLNKLSSYGIPIMFIHMKDFYVYLAPFVYFIELHNKEYSEEVSFFRLHPYDIQKMKVSFDQTGKVLLTE